MLLFKQRKHAHMNPNQPPSNQPGQFPNQPPVPPPPPPGLPQQPLGQPPIIPPPASIQPRPGVPPAPPPPAQQPQYPQQPSGSKKKIIVILAALLVVAAVIGVIVFMFLMRDDSQDAELANGASVPAESEPERASEDDIKKKFEEYDALYSFNADTVSEAIQVVPATADAEGRDERSEESGWYNRFVYVPSTPQTCRYYRGNLQTREQATDGIRSENWKDYDSSAGLVMGAFSTHLLSEGCGDWTGARIRVFN